MNLIKLSAAAFTALSLSICSFLVLATEKPVKHLDLPEITNAQHAEQVFIETTAQLKSKETLNSEELQEIHVITYSLEKAIEYYVKNSANERKDAAVKLAETVESIHINSENDRQVETKKYLVEYFELAESFINN